MTPSSWGDAWRTAWLAALAAQEAHRDFVRRLASAPPAAPNAARVARVLGRLADDPTALVDRGTPLQRALAQVLQATDAELAEALRL